MYVILLCHICLGQNYYIEKNKEILRTSDQLWPMHAELGLQHQEMRINLIYLKGRC